MNKLSFFFTTLVAAVPAAFLAYLCVTAFLLHSDTLPPALMGVIGLTLLLSVAVLAMPAAVLLKKSRPPAADETPGPAAENAAENADEFGGDDGEVEDLAADGDAEEDPFAETDADGFDDFDDTPKKKR